MNNQYLDLSKQSQIERLINHCQHLQDVAFDLDLVKDKWRIDVIDETVADLKRQIDRLKLSVCLTGEQ